MTTFGKLLTWRVAGGVPCPHPLILAGFAALLALLVLLVDRPLSHTIREAGPELRGFFLVFSDWGNSRWFLWPFGLAGVFCWLQCKSHPTRRRAAGYGWAASAFLYLFTAVAFSGIVVNLLKILFGRARPLMFYHEGIQGFFPPGFDGDFQSLPSGHASTAFACAVAVALLWPKARVWLLALAAFIASARVGINKHFLSDILAAAAVATVTTFWLRQRFAEFGICFERDRAGQARVKPEGRLVLRKLLGQKGAVRTRALRAIRPASY